MSDDKNIQISKEIIEENDSDKESDISVSFDDVLHIIHALTKDVIEIKDRLNELERKFELIGDVMDNKINKYFNVPVPSKFQTSSCSSTIPVRRGYNQYRKY